MKAIVKQPIHEWPFSTPSLLSAIFQHRSLGIRVRESVGELRLAANSRHLTTGVARAVLRVSPFCAQDSCTHYSALYVATFHSVTFQRSRLDTLGVFKFSQPVAFPPLIHVPGVPHDRGSITVIVRYIVAKAGLINDNFRMF